MPEHRLNDELTEGGRIQATVPALGGAIGHAARRRKPAR